MSPTKGFKLLFIARHGGGTMKNDAEIGCGLALREENKKQKEREKDRRGFL
jgi:hypothetical protein